MMLLLLLLSKPLHQRLRWVAPVVRSLEDLALPSTAPTTPKCWGGWSLPGRVRVAGLQGGGSRTNRRYCCLLSKSVRGPETAPDTPCRQCLQSWATVGTVQSGGPTELFSCYVAWILQFSDNLQPYTYITWLLTQAVYSCILSISQQPSLSRW